MIFCAIFHMWYKKMSRMTGDNESTGKPDLVIKLSADSSIVKAAHP